MRFTRREALQRGAMFGLFGLSLPLAISTGCADADVCTDPDLLSTAQLRMRETLQFTESSPHGPQRECAGCQFFTTGADAGACGRCQILQGPANPRGHCDSWAQRPKFGRRVMEWGVG